jgi:hypothetical protein
MKQLIACAAVLFGVSTAPAVAQSCNTTIVVTPQGSLSNKVPGPPAPTSVAAVRLTFGNDVTSDCDADSGNGGVSQSVHPIILRPSCNFVGDACVNDPGGDDGNPATPAVELFSLDATTCTGGLANIMVDSSDPFAVKLDFVVAVTFPPNTGCSVDVTLHVRERGDATTTNTVAQQYTTHGVCLCEPGLIAGSTTSSQIFLTCPPCSANFCAPQHCGPPTFQCVADPTPDCSNPDNDLCTSGSCDPTANGGNGACVNGPRTVCGNENNPCAPGHCAAATGNCVLDSGPNCNDNDPCTDDACNQASGCVHSPRPTTTFYRDRDGDGFGDPRATQSACTAPAGYVALGGDCDDTNANVHPGVPELCNGIDDNCDGGIDEDASGIDSDGDGIHNACDNCRSAYNAEQLDTDDDHVGNSCDNCVFDSNPTQSDFDHDGEGDICDFNDGLIYIRSTDRNYREWQPEVGYTSWNSYRGSLAVLRATGQYTQAPGSNSLAAHDCGVSGPYVLDLDVPAPGEVAFNLVTGVVGGVESSLGKNSAGVPRANANRCP